MSDLRREWRDLAPEWIREEREGRNPTRRGLLDPPVIAACGDVAGIRALDCGCGEGRLCRILAARGARCVLGLDTCEAMIAAARELQGSVDEYRCADVQDLSFLPEGSFDLAVSYLNQCDLPDFEANTREVFRVLRAGGRFVVANLHPMRSAVGHWLKDEEGEKRHVVLDRYFDEGERQWRMMGCPFTNFHRSLQTTIRGFLGAGFALLDLIEPSITPENLRAYPELADELRVPNFIVYALRKPGA
ncbi:MAG: class I SAM-dependent methyltransferase [Armatimonadetes bacterium]|nr:class I SAM-dependent methyltransferase [Armatimonadota bacterium]